jgi:hypothetical protein
VAVTDKEINTQQISGQPPPPPRRVADIKSLSSFNLRKEGVQVEVVEWVGDLDHFSELKEVWILFEGIPPRWCDWKVFAQMSSSFGMMIDVDWSALFKSFYEKVRIKIACRSLDKIPQERLFELDKKLYLVSISVEGVEHQEARNSGDNGDGDDPGGDDEEGRSDDDYDDLDDPQDLIETDKQTLNIINSKSTSGGQRSVSGPRAVTFSQEGRALVPGKNADVVNKRRYEENVSVTGKLSTGFEALLCEGIMHDGDVNDAGRECWDQIDGFTMCHSQEDAIEGDGTMVANQTEDDKDIEVNQAEELQMGGQSQGRARGCGDSFSLNQTDNQEVKAPKGYTQDQSPESITHLYVDHMTEEGKEEDEEHTWRWVEMLNNFSQQEGTGEELLRAMEMVEEEDDLGKHETLIEGQMELDNETVDKIIIARSMEP